MQEDNKTLQKELNDLLFSRPSLFKEFLDSRRKEGKQYTLLILGYIQSKGGHKVPLRDIKNKLVYRSQRKKSKKDNDRGNMHETTLYRLLKELVDNGILEKSEEIKTYERSNPDKQKKNSFYNLSKKAFKRLEYEDPETRKNRLIAIRYAELDIAKEIIRECGMDAEFQKRYHERHVVKVEEEPEEEERLWKEWDEAAAKAGKNKGDMFSYKGITGTYQGTKEEIDEENKKLGIIETNS